MESRPHSDTSGPGPTTPPSLLNLSHSDQVQLCSGHNMHQSDCIPSVSCEYQCMSLPSSHSKVRDGVIVGFEDLGIVENLVSERVEPVQGHFDVSGGHPVLQQMQHRLSFSAASSSGLKFTV